MGDIARWLLHDDQKDLYNLVFALVLNILFLGLIALLLWPLGNLMLVFQLAKGYGILWIAIVVTVALLTRIQRLFRVNLYDYPNAYVFSNLAVSSVLQAGWAAFAVLTVQNVMIGAPTWMIVILYIAALLSCYIAFGAVSSFFQGQIYRFFNLPLALISFLVFSLWPAGARMLYGWFFQLF